MPITVFYNNDDTIPCTLRPTPLISINTSINKTGGGETLGVTYTITLTGTILADRGSPLGAYSVTKQPFQTEAPDGTIGTPVIDAVGTGVFGPYNLFWTGSNYDVLGPYPQIVPNDHALDSVFSKQKAIRALFARDGQLMEITPVHGDAALIYCNPRVLSIEFEDGIYVDKCNYTIQLEADTLRDKDGYVNREGLSLYIKDGALTLSSALDGSTVYADTTEAEYLAAGKHFITDFSEEWSLDTDDANAETIGASGTYAGYLKPRSYSITHNMSAVGKTHYLPDGTKLRGWREAKGFVQKQLFVLNSGSPIYNYPNSNNYSLTPDGVATPDINSQPSVIAGLIGEGTLDLIASYGGYNRIVNESIDEAGGSYSLTETWVLATGTAFETYNINVSKGIDDSFTSVSIDGNIKGLTSANQASFGGLNSSSVKINRPANAGADRMAFMGADAATGLAVSGAYMNAVKKYHDVTGNGSFDYSSPVYKRANFAVTYDDTTYRRLNPIPKSQSAALNEAAGTIDYNATYDNRPINILSGVLYENISINDTYPGDSFATIPVIGRSTGPILQYIGGRSEYTRDVTIECLVDRNRDAPDSRSVDFLWGNPMYETVSLSSSASNFLAAGFTTAVGGQALLPQKPSIVEPTRTQLQQLLMQLSPVNEPGIRKYFLSPPQESWSPKEGRYNLSISWTYELDR